MKFVSAYIAYIAHMLQTIFLQVLLILSYKFAMALTQGEKKKGGNKTNNVGGYCQFKMPSLLAKSFLENTDEVFYFMQW